MGPISDPEQVETAFKFMEGILGEKHLNDLVEGMSHEEAVNLIRDGMKSSLEMIIKAQGPDKSIAISKMQESLDEILEKSDGIEHLGDNSLGIFIHKVLDRQSSAYHKGKIANDILEESKQIEKFLSDPIAQHAEDLINHLRYRTLRYGGHTQEDFLHEANLVRQLQSAHSIEDLHSPTYQRFLQEAREITHTQEPDEVFQSLKSVYLPEDTTETTIEDLDTTADDTNLTEDLDTITDSTNLTGDLDTTADNDSLTEELGISVDDDNLMIAAKISLHHGAEEIASQLPHNQLQELAEIFSAGKEVINDTSNLLEASINHLAENLDSLINQISDSRVMSVISDANSTIHDFVSTLTPLDGLLGGGIAGSGYIITAGLKKALSLIGARLRNEITTLDMAKQILEVVLVKGMTATVMAATLGLIVTIIPASLASILLPLMGIIGGAFLVKRLIYDLPNAFWQGLDSSQRQQIIDLWESAANFVMSTLQRLWNFLCRKVREAVNAVKVVVKKVVRVLKDFWEWLFGRGGSGESFA